MTANRHIVPWVRASVQLLIDWVVKTLQRIHSVKSTLSTLGLYIDSLHSEHYKKSPETEHFVYVGRH